MDLGAYIKATSLPATICCMVDLGAELDSGVDLLIVGNRIGKKASSVDKGSHAVSGLIVIAAEVTGGAC